MSSYHSRGSVHVEMWQASVCEFDCANCGVYDVPISWIEGGADCPSCRRSYDPKDGSTLKSKGKLGWWWWACFPGCMPDGDYSGPFDTEEQAIADAFEGVEEEEERDEEGEGELGS